MTRNDFEIIADELRKCRPPADGSDEFLAGRHFQFEHMCEAIADRLKSNNPRFQTDRFFKACGLHE